MVMLKRSTPRTVAPITAHGVSSTTRFGYDTFVKAVVTACVQPAVCSVQVFPKHLLVFQTAL